MIRITLKNIKSIKDTFYLYDSSWGGTIITPVSYTLSFQESTSLKFKIIAAEKPDSSFSEFYISIFNKLLKNKKIRVIEKKDFPLYLNWAYKSDDFTETLKNV